MMALLAKAVIWFVGFVGVNLIGKLPTSPFSELGANPMGSAWTQAVGFFLPVSGIISHTASLLGAVAVWMALRWVFRLIRAVG